MLIYKAPKIKNWLWAAGVLGNCWYLYGKHFTNHRYKMVMAMMMAYLIKTVDVHYNRCVYQNTWTGFGMPVLAQLDMTCRF